MKKFIYRLLFYIGLTISLFNPVPATADNSIPLPFEEQFKQMTDKEKEALSKNNEFVKLIAVFLLADKLYPDKDINNDMTGLLKIMWPTTDVEKLKTFEKVIKYFVMLKRRHNYVTDRLRHKIKASGILPEDAPIVAKYGEYAPLYPDATKQTADNEYKVKYIPYKYIEYDGGNLGEPVRRRDKNYEPVRESVIDEINLALIEFDVPAFFKALRKLPVANDGTREKAVELENGAKSRLLLDLVGLGDEEQIKSVMEVYVPKGWYINGDILNTKSKPKFFLSEDKTEDLNIKEFQLFFPDANGVVNHGKSRRVWVGSTRFPITFTRRDISKGLNIKGSFQFEMCHIKTDECHTVVSQNSLRRPATVDRLTSLHTNFVTMGYARVPPKKTRHAEIKDAFYNPETKKLTVKFATTKKFSNVAAMAEDSAKTSFLTPQYNINSNGVTANFDIMSLTATEAQQLSATDLENSIKNGGDIAITAAFDEMEVIRDIVTPKIVHTPKAVNIMASPAYATAYLFGIILSIMPGILYFLQRLLSYFVERKKPLLVFVRYASATFIGISLWTIHNRLHPWYGAYESSWLLITALVLSVSYISAMLGYMNFNLFRPFKKIARRGFFIGAFTIAFAVISPCFYKVEVLDNITALPLNEALISMLFVWFGILTLPFIGLCLSPKMSDQPLKLQFLNLTLMVIFGLEMLYMAYGCRGITGLLTAVVTSAMVIGLWYAYPIAIAETIRHKRTLKDQEELFRKVQKHCTFLIIVIWMMGSVIMSFIPVKDQALPYLEEIQQHAEKNIKNNKATLFILMQNWSPLDIFMHKTFNYLQERNIEVNTYKASAENKNMSLWLKTYGRISPQLSVLYTSRHKKGLVLPHDIHNLDWREAVTVFPKTEQERKDENI